MKKNIIGLAIVIMILAAGAAYGANDHSLAFEGYQQMRQGNLKMAVKLFKKALRANPHNGNALLNLGVVFHKTDRSEAACRLFKKILKLNARGIVTISGHQQHIGTSLADMARKNLKLLGKL